MGGAGIGWVRGGGGGCRMKGGLGSEGGGCRRKEVGWVGGDGEFYSFFPSAQQVSELVSSHQHAPPGLFANLQEDH